MSEIKDILDKYINNFYNESDDKEAWFNHVKELTESLDGYTSDMKAYKENPDAYKGNVADVSTVIRVAITSKDQTPDLYEIMRLLGKEEIINRINSL
jgi:glutamyl-tRNA synthetase